MLGAGAEDKIYKIPAFPIDGKSRQFLKEKMISNYSFLIKKQ